MMRYFFSALLLISSTTCAMQRAVSFVQRAVGLRSYAVPPQWCTACQKVLSQRRVDECSNFKFLQHKISSLTAEAYAVYLDKQETGLWCQDMADDLHEHAAILEQQAERLRHKGESMACNPSAKVCYYTNE